MNRIHVLYTTILLLTIKIGCIVSFPPESDSTAISTILSTKNATFAYTTTPLVHTSTSMPNPIPPTTRIPETFTSTPTSAPPTLTPAPTLSEEDESILMTKLLDTNGGCYLPCWWGFTPGETNWKTISEFFNSLGRVIDPSTIEDQSTSRFTIPEYLNIFPYFAVDENKILFMTNILLENDIFPEGGYVFGDPQFLQAVHRYTLSSVLKIFGEPSQILLFHRRPTYDPGPTWWDYTLTLFFSKVGILVQYYGESVQHGDIYRICPRDIGIIYIWLWSPNRNLSMEEVYSVLPEYPGQAEMLGFKVLEEVTEYDIVSFSKEFQNDFNCFETPINVWK